MATHTVIPPVKLHHRLRIALEWASLEPEDMAVTLDMHINSVHNYIAGRTTPKHPVLVLWAETCKVPVDWLKNGANTDDVSRGDFLQWENQLTFLFPDQDFTNQILRPGPELSLSS